MGFQWSLDTWLWCFFVVALDWLFLSSLVMIQTCQVNRSKIQSSDKTWIGIIFLRSCPCIEKLLAEKVVDFFFKKLIGQKVGNQSCILVTCAWLVCSSYNWYFNVTLFLEHQDSAQTLKHAPLNKMLPHHSNPLWAKPLMGTLNPKP